MRLTFFLRSVVFESRLYFKSIVSYTPCLQFLLETKTVLPSMQNDDVGNLVFNERIK